MRMQLQCFMSCLLVVEVGRRDMLTGQIAQTEIVQVHGRLRGRVLGNGAGGGVLPGFIGIPVVVQRLYVGKRLLQPRCIRIFHVQRRLFFFRMLSRSLSSGCGRHFMGLILQQKRMEQDTRGRRPRPCTHYAPTVGDDSQGQDWRKPSPVHAQHLYSPFGTPLPASLPTLSRSSNRLQHVYNPSCSQHVSFLQVASPSSTHPPCPRFAPSAMANLPEGLAQFEYQKMQVRVLRRAPYHSHAHHSSAHRKPQRCR